MLSVQANLPTAASDGMYYASDGMYYVIDNINCSHAFVRMRLNSSANAQHSNMHSNAIHINFVISIL